jgi:hypothetical protein
MVQSNENADLLKNNNGGDKNPANGIPPGSGKKNQPPEKDDGKKEAARDVVIDIKKYLQKAKLGKSAADLMEVLFKGKTFKASEWPEKVKEALNRPVKR